MNVRKYTMRLALVILSVGTLDCLWVFFARTPLPGATLIPAMTPLWVAVFVILPMLRESKSHQD